MKNKCNLVFHNCIVNSENLENIKKGFSSIYGEYERDAMSNPIDIDFRKRFRKEVEIYSKPGSSLLELNAGSGLDALYFASNNYQVLGTDIAANSKILFEEKITANPLLKMEYKNVSFEKLDELSGMKFNHIYSNHSGLNCTNNLNQIFSQFKGLLYPGGYVTLMVMPKFCPWEILSIINGNNKALRRFKAEPIISNVDGFPIETYYHSPKKIIMSLGSSFHSVNIQPIGLIYPVPFFKTFKNKKIIGLFTGLDEKICTSRLFNLGIGDCYIITARLSK